MGTVTAHLKINNLGASLFLNEQIKSQITKTVTMMFKPTLTAICQCDPITDKPKLCLLRRQGKQNSPG
jgi:hypothetical protein